MTSENLKVGKKMETEKDQTLVSNCGVYVNYINGFHSTLKYSIPTTSAAQNSLAELIANKIILEKEIFIPAQSQS